MTKKLIYYNPNEAGQLHCDACHYDLPRPQPFTRDLIGTPCPECGENMLTERDFNSTARMFSVINFLNRALGWLLGTELTPENLAKHTSVSVKIHDGATSIKIQDQPHD